MTDRQADDTARTVDGDDGKRARSSDGERSDDGESPGDGSRPSGGGRSNDERPSRSRADDAGTAREVATSTGTSAVEDGDPAADGEEPEVPVWDDEYFERVSGRLMYNFDLERDREAAGERFPLYGRMDVLSQKHLFHPALNYANHESTEHLFATRVDGVGVPDLERYVDLGHELAEAWIDADEEHFSTDFTFALVAPRVDDPVREFVAGFKDRNLLTFGYYGHYEVNLLVVAPDEEEIVTSRSTDLDRAFATWTTPEEGSSGLLDRLF